MQVLQPANPCAPGGVSTTTPEFCVNLTEIKLLNNDAEADVSLTLVNRTGRRLFLALPHVTYLTDSSGTKWAQTKNTGIPYGVHHNALPLEPNGEAQVSFLFGRSGQAPPDLTFSMRGEVAIMKVDSRGEAVRNQVQVTRGFNISGIRVMPEPSQAGGTPQQNVNTRLGKVSARDLNAATPKALGEPMLLSEPGAVAATSNPCGQRGVSSAAPEFCLYLTEIRLLNNDTEADVSLTLVNRTGRRLFLALPHVTYLTDSSGTKWAQTKNTGIPYGVHHNALPVEPNGEAQLSFMFGRSGSAPPDITISMRGELAIMKVDSRGEAVRNEVQLTRGFNISGIRAIQQ
jgi:hypothetical protein